MIIQQRHKKYTSMENCFAPGRVTTVWADKGEQESIVQEILGNCSFQLMRFINANNPDTILNPKKIKRIVKKQTSYSFKELEQVLCLEETYRKYRLDNWDYFKLELVQVILEQPNILFLSEPFQHEEFSTILYALSDYLPNTTFIFFDDSVMATDHSDDILEAHEILPPENIYHHEPDLAILN